MDKKPLKVDLHTHTADDPHDKIRYSPEELIDYMAGHGFDAVAITNHNSARLGPRAQGYAKERGILLIKGMELNYRRQDVLLLNFKGADGITSPDEVMRHKGADNLVVAAHPYFPFANSCGRLLDSCPGLFDAIEYAHLYISLVNFNQQAVRKAEEFSLPLIGTSDAHRLSQVGYTYTLVHSEKTTEAVVAAIKDGKSELVTRPLPLTAFLGTIAWMKYQSLKRIL